MSRFSLVLFQPEIPGNTGALGRTALALDLELILIKPYAFDLSEKAVRRAGLDYWKYVNLKEFDNWQDFIETRKPHAHQLIFLSKHGKQVYYHASFQLGSYLVFGSETKGLPPEIFHAYPEQFFSLPMYSDKIRSLNLANAATAVAYEGLRQIDFALPR